MNADWTMVIITAIYVLATVFIMFANQRSAKSAKEQLAEMKREHEESIRYGIMPFLQMEDIAETKYSCSAELPLATESDWNGGNIIRIKNIGNGAATNLRYTWTGGDISIPINEAFPINAIKASGEYTLYISFPCVKDRINSVTGNLTFHYDDMRGYSYDQRITFSFLSNRTYTGVNEIHADIPVCVGVKGNN